MTRRQSVLVLVALGVAALATALLLLHSAGHQTLQGSRPDPDDPDAPAEGTQVRVECSSPASGPRLADEGQLTDVGAMADADGIAEDDGYRLGEEGVDSTDVADACGRIRAERLAHAGELGVLGLLLAGAAGFVVLSGRTAPRPTGRITALDPPPGRRP